LQTGLTTWSVSTRTETSTSWPWLRRRPALSSRSVRCLRAKRDKPRRSVSPTSTPRRRTRVGNRGCRPLWGGSCSLPERSRRGGRRGRSGAAATAAATRQRRQHRTRNAIVQGGDTDRLHVDHLVESFDVQSRRACFGCVREGLPGDALTGVAETQVPGELDPAATTRPSRGDGCCHDCGLRNRRGARCDRLGHDRRLRNRVPDDTNSPYTSWSERHFSLLPSRALRRPRWRR
jgi:hypothetical protein